MDIYRINLYNLKSNEGVFWFDWTGFGALGDCTIIINGHAMGYIDNNGKIKKFYDEITNPDTFKTEWENMQNNCKSSKKEL